MDTEFDSAANDNENLIEYKQATNIKIGDYMVINEFPCRIVDRSTSKTGKHGGCKIHFIGIDIFTQKKYETLCNSGENVRVPIVTKRDYQIININDETPAYLSLMAEDKSLREDIRLPDNEMGQKINEEFVKGRDILVTIQKAMKQEMVVSYKLV